MSSRNWRIRTVDTADEAEWEELLASDSRSLPFQHPRYLLRYLRHHPGTKGHWLELRDEEGRLQSGISFLVSEKMSLWAVASGIAGTYGGPLSRDPEAEEAVLEAYLRWGGKRVVRRELLWGHSIPPAAGQKRLTPLRTAIFELQGGFDAFWRSTFSNNRRSECNRNEKRGLYTEESRDPRVLELFYPLYLERCRQWRTPILSLDYLREVLEEEETALLTVAWFEGRLVGVHFCFVLPGELFAWLGTSQRLQRVFPSTALMKTDVESALAKGLFRVNLGSNVGLVGVAEFKKLLGAQSDTRWHLLEEAAWLRAWRKWRG